MTREAVASEFALHLASYLDREAKRITREWVDLLDDRLGTEPERVLPGDDLLNHIPIVLRKIAEYLRDPGDMPLDDFVVEDLSKLAELRRRQGFDVHEILVEYELLSDLIQQHIESAAERFDGAATTPEVVDLMGRLKDSLYLLSTLTARFYRAWSTRQATEFQSALHTFGTIIGHEMRNQLGAAETALRMLIERGEEMPVDRRSSFLDIVLESIGGARDTVEEVRVLLTATVSGDRRQWIGLRALVDQLVRQNRPLAEEKGVRLEIEGEFPNARVEGVRLRLVLANLIANAIRYSDTAKESPRVVIRAEDLSDNWLRVEVEDNGIGIPPDAQQNVFDSWFRGSDREDGKGLGLAIAREAIEQLGGRIGLDSRIGEGTTVFLELQSVASEVAGVGDPPDAALDLTDRENRF